tara:strand:+ start:176 stop:742 length:567 start_codon:yes stop_codon:yes gene_type:complete
MKTLTIESKIHGTHDILLDDEDYDRVKEGIYWIHPGPGKNRKLYVRGRQPQSSDSRWNKKHMLHRFIMNAPATVRGGTGPKVVVDHKNGDPLDNRKDNLRLCSQKDNCRNIIRKPRGKVPYYGVVYIPKGVKKYGVRLYGPDKADKRYKKIWLGCYATAEEAARVYDKYVIEQYGEFATLNFPEELVE